MKMIRSLLLFVILLTLSSQALVVLAQSMPGMIYGHVIYNGSGVGGVTVSLSGAESKQATTDSNGYYQFGVSQGNTYTVSATYNGHTASKTVAVNYDQVNVNLDTTSHGASGGSSGGTFTYLNPATPMPTITPTPTAVPSSTITVTATVTGTPGPSVTPAPTPMASPSGDSGSLWWLLALSAIIVVVAGATYFLFIRKN